MARIELTDVTKRWGGFYAVDHLNLVIEDNAFVTLLGPSGCGKTTTLRMIAGLETPTSGRITIDGVPVFDGERGINVPANKRHVGFLFQNYALWPNMTVYQNIAFGLKNIKEPRRLSRGEIDAIVQRVSRIVKIGMFLDRYPSELSGGQQQRVAIARTLAPDPKVLFMDEPLSNLDAKLRLEMRSELQRLHLETGSTFVYVTHDQMEAMTLATRICLIDNGVLQQYDEPLTVYNRPTNLFVADFVGNPAVNFIEARGTGTKDGGLTLECLNGRAAVFTPDSPLDLGAWRARADEAIQADEAARSHDKVAKSNKDVPFAYRVARVDDNESTAKASEADEMDFVLGARPERVRIHPNGAVEGEVFSAMPTGMETTVRIRVGDLLLTGVTFGGVTYKLGERVKLDIESDHIMLFSRGNGRLITLGSLRFLQ